VPAAGSTNSMPLRSTTWASPWYQRMFAYVGLLGSVSICDANTPEMDSLRALPEATALSARAAVSTRLARSRSRPFGKSRR